MNTIGIAANRQEILKIADSVAQEKIIDRKIVLEAMEEAIQKAARSRYGQEHDIRAELNSETGETKLWLVHTVAETVEDHTRQISLETAQNKNPDAQIGTEIKELLPPFEFGRVAAQTAKQVILQKVHDAERARQYKEYKDRVGEIVNGLVKRVEYGHVIVDLGQAEGVIRRHDGLPRENFNPGDRVRSYIYKVSNEVKGQQIFLSRTHPDFMVSLFAQEVPEVYEGVIEIKARARDPGSRAKIGVISHDPSIDPVGACVGMRGARVQAVVGELQGEKIDIIPWSPDKATFIVNALQPAEVSRVIIDEEEERAEVVVAENQFPLAVGRRGQNVRLASQLSGWQIDLTTEAKDSERRQKEFQTRTELFMQSLDADEMLAQLLASEGFAMVEEIAWVDIASLATIEGFDEDVAGELQTRAREYLEKIAAENEKKRKTLGVEDNVASLDGVNPDMAVRFGENQIKSLEDLAGMTPDDLIGWKEPGPNGRPKFQPGLLRQNEMSREEAELFIIRARIAAGWLEAEAYQELLAKHTASLEAEEARFKAEAEAEAKIRETPADALFNTEQNKETPADQ